MYYQQTPISEKPEKDDTYFVKFKGVPELSEVIYEGNKWHSNWMQIAEFWLKPITGVVMTEEELKEMWVAAINYENDKRLGRLLNNSIDFTEYIKRFKL